jgi:hypothetical protein
MFFSSTQWPSRSSSDAAFRTATTASGSIGLPSGGVVVKPMRSRLGARVASTAQGSEGVGGVYGSPGNAPAMASRYAAVSRTVRVTQKK